MARSPERLKSAIGAGLLSFPVTHFTDEGAFAPGPYQEHIEYLVGHRPAALFAAGGTGEFFSLQLAEYEDVIAAAVESARGSCRSSRTSAKARRWRSNLQSGRKRPAPTGFCCCGII